MGKRIIVQLQKTIQVLEDLKRILRKYPEEKEHLQDVEETIEGLKKEVIQIESSKYNIDIAFKYIERAAILIELISKFLF